MNVSNKDKKMLKDMPADEIKAILNSDNISHWCYKYEKWNEESNDEDLYSFSGDQTYRTKPMSLIDQLNELKAWAEAESKREKVDAFEAGYIEAMNMVVESINSITIEANNK